MPCAAPRMAAGHSARPKAFSLETDFDMSKKTESSSSRSLLTTEDLERLTVDDYLRLKLTDAERAQLRKINEARAVTRAARAVRIRAEQELLLRELQAAGLQVLYVSDLLSKPQLSERVIPILLRHLQLAYSDVTKNTIARCLAVPEPEVRRAWMTLVEEYRKAPMGRGICAPGDTEELPLGAKEGLACALSAAVTSETIGQLVAIAKDRRNGESRILLLRALRKSKSDVAKGAIEDLATDPDLATEIGSWRTRRRSSSDLPP